MGGVPAKKIVFSGVGKTREELRYALDKRILQINVESLPELKLLSEIACQLGVEAEIAVRVNPDVDAVTHEKITTGRQENKFGIDISAAVVKRSKVVEKNVDGVGKDCMNELVPGGVAAG